MTETSPETSETQSSGDTTKNVAFFNPFDGVKGRDGGPYLDFVEREAAEKVRAQKEGREPVSGGSTPASVGTPLVTARQVIDNSVNSNISRANAPGFEVAISDESFTEADFLADPVDVHPVDFGTEPPEDDNSEDGNTSASPDAREPMSEEDAELAGETTATEDPVTY